MRDTDCPECGSINFGINPRCVCCVRKIYGERIEELEEEIRRLRGGINILNAHLTGSDQDFAFSLLEGE